MLQYTEVPHSTSRPRTAHLTPVDHPVRTISGRRLNRLLKAATATDRALLAHELERGTLRILDLTRTQAAALTKSSPSYVATVAGLSEAERVQLARGQLSLARGRKRRHRHIASDNDIDRIVAELGAERVFAALDRLTAPPIAPHSHNGAAPHFHQEPQKDHHAR